MDGWIDGSRVLLLVGCYYPSSSFFDRLSAVVNSILKVNM